MDRKNVLINLGIVAASVLLVFAGLEVALRIGVIKYDGSYIPEQNRIRYCGEPGQRTTQFHSLYGWVGHPNQDFLWKLTTEDGWGYFAHNEAGFNDRYDSGNRTAIVLGDSFTYGSLTSTNSTFSFFLDAWSPRVAFKNYGMKGYGTTNHLVLYQNVSDYVEHDLVVLAYYLGNDVYNNANDSLTAERRPIFKLLPNGSLQFVRPPQSMTSKKEQRLVKTSIASTIDATLERHTVTYNFLRPRLKSLLRILIGYNKYEPMNEDRFTYNLELTQKLIEKLATEAARNDADLLIVPLPSRSDVHPTNENTTKYQDAKRSWEMQRSMLLTASATHDNTELLPLKPVLKHEISKGNQVYGTVDAHLNEYGHRVAARAIYNFLLQTGHINDGQMNFSKDYRKHPGECPA